MVFGLLVGVVEINYAALKTVFEVDKQATVNLLDSQNVTRQALFVQQLVDRDDVKLDSRVVRQHIMCFEMRNVIQNPLPRLERAAPKTDGGGKDLVVNQDRKRDLHCLLYTSPSPRDS